MLDDKLEGRYPPRKRANPVTLTNIQAMNAPNNTNKKDDSCLFLRDEARFGDLRKFELLDEAIFGILFFLVFSHSTIKDK